MTIIQSILQPIIVDLLVWGVVSVIGVIASGLPGFLRRRVEAVDRQAVYHAVDTVATLLFAAVRRNPAAAVTDAAISGAARGVLDKMPGVVRRLAPTQAAIEDMIRARLQERLDAALGRDRLAEELRRLGLEAVTVQG
ncbi:hypothetical protein [Paracoccus alkenifer]|uniref:Bacteriophage holin of superfamily 6 (Holin_LLH) n=1 Tax=Paracoccus alkenifer TaxID=65735 RepID=A0A1H6NBL0_9RHOB|nr:hypothetical protein [Paracoccus alkenifer]SEI10290.1 hypothetical protein SAMN04488075_2888 [Paracoccus alkenifer]